MLGLPWRRRRGFQLCLCRDSQMQALWGTLTLRPILVIPYTSFLDNVAGREQCSA